MKVQLELDYGGNDLMDENAWWQVLSNATLLAQDHTVHVLVDGKSSTHTTLPAPEPPEVTDCECEYPFHTLGGCDCEVKLPCGHR